jgi:hypothetical protein
MPAIEELLRQELKHAAEKVQPEQLRLLHVPAPGRRRYHRWHLRLIPVAAAAAVVAIIALAAPLVSGTSSPRPPVTSTSVPAALPRYYLTYTYVKHAHQLAPQTEVVIRNSASGQVTGKVAVLSNGEPAILNATAAADDRSFIIGASEWGPGGWPDYRFFRLRISASGRPGPLTELASPVVPRDYGVSGFTLSPDGRLLAISTQFHPPGSTDWVGKIEVVNLATGKIRTWSAPAQGDHYYIAGPPSWADGDRMIAFTWQRSVNLTTTNTVMEGVRLLDIAAPDHNLMDSKLIVSSQAIQGTIQSALITPDGRDVIVAASRDIASGRNTGTVVAQIVAVQAGSGRVIRVLRTQTARYNLLTRYVLDGSSEVLSLDPTGRYALVQCLQFGWMDIGDLEPGRFTPLAAFPPGQEAFWAAW